MKDIENIHHVEQDQDGSRSPEEQVHSVHLSQQLPLFSVNKKSRYLYSLYY